MQARAKLYRKLTHISVILYATEHLVYVSPPSIRGVTLNARFSAFIGGVRMRRSECFTWESVTKEEIATAGAMSYSVLCVELKMKR